MDELISKIITDNPSGRKSLKDDIFENEELQPSYLIHQIFLFASPLLVIATIICLYGCFACFDYFREGNFRNFRYRMRMRFARLSDRWLRDINDQNGQNGQNVPNNQGMEMQQLAQIMNGRPIGHI